MRIDSPRGVKAWLIGLFSGSFKGHLEGTADTASYVADEAIEDITTRLTGSFVKIEGDENITGSLTITGDENKGLTVLGKIIVAGSGEVTGTLHVSESLEVGEARLVYQSNSLEVKF